MSDSKKTRVGVIGIGKMGMLHLEKYSRMPPVEIVGIYDSNPACAKSASQRYGVRVMENLADLLFEADAVSITTPTASHFHIARQALEARLHVLLEKPMTLTLEDAERLVRMAKERNLVFQVGLLERYRYRALVETLGTTKIKAIQSHRYAVHPGRETTLDVVMDLMIHDLDLAVSVLGREPLKISAANGIEVATDRLDIANAELSFGGQITARLSASRVSASRVRDFQIWFEGGYASLDFLTNVAQIYYREGAVSVKTRTISLPDLDPLGAQCGDFVGSVRENHSPLVIAQEGLVALKWALAIQRSVGSGDFERQKLLEMENLLHRGESLSAASAATKQ